MMRLHEALTLCLDTSHTLAQKGKPFFAPWCGGGFTVDEVLAADWQVKTDKGEILDDSNMYAPVTTFADCKPKEEWKKAVDATLRKFNFTVGSQWKNGYGTKFTVLETDSTFSSDGDRYPIKTFMGEDRDDNRWFTRDGIWSTCGQAAKLDIVGPWEEPAPTVQQEIPAPPNTTYFFNPDDLTCALVWPSIGSVVSDDFTVSFDTPTLYTNSGPALDPGDEIRFGDPDIIYRPAPASITTPPCPHVWVDTGMGKRWCKHDGCKAEQTFSMTGGWTDKQA